jgi:RNA polymerase-binding transcription factor DksA
MKTIQVKYLGPTNTKGSRWKAFTDMHSATIPYDHASNAETNAWDAAEALIEKHGLAWVIQRIDSLPNGDYVCCLDWGCTA